MDRYVLTDAQWAKMEPHCRGKQSDPGRSGADSRRFVEAVEPDMEYATVDATIVKRLPRLSPIGANIGLAR